MQKENFPNSKPIQLYSMKPQSLDQEKRQEEKYSRKKREQTIGQKLKMVKNAFRKIEENNIIWEVKQAQKQQRTLFWSETNIIGFSTKSGLSAKTTPFLEYPVYIFEANHPWKHQPFVTPHKGPIEFVVFQENSVPRFLTCDASFGLCLWQTPSSLIDRFKITHKFKVHNIVSVAWFYLPKGENANARENTKENTKTGPQTHFFYPAFLTLSKMGRITIYFEMKGVATYCPFFADIHNDFSYITNAVMISDVIVALGTQVVIIATVEEVSPTNLNIYSCHPEFEIFKQTGRKYFPSEFAIKLVRISPENYEKTIKIVVVLTLANSQSMDKDDDLQHSNDDSDPQGYRSILLVFVMHLNRYKQNMREMRLQDKQEQNSNPNEDPTKKNPHTQAQQTQPQIPSGTTSGQGQEMRANQRLFKQGFACEKKFQMHFKEEISTLHFSKKGRMIALTAKSGKLFLLDAIKFTQIASFETTPADELEKGETPAAPISACFSPNSHAIAVLLENHKLRVFLVPNRPVFSIQEHQQTQTKENETEMLMKQLKIDIVKALINRYSVFDIVARLQLEDKVQVDSIILNLEQEIIRKKGIPSQLYLLFLQPFFSVFDNPRIYISFIIFFAIQFSLEILVSKKNTRLFGPIMRATSDIILFIMRAILVPYDPFGLNDLKQPLDVSHFQSDSSKKFSLISVSDFLCDNLGFRWDFFPYLNQLFDILFNQDFYTILLQSHQSIKGFEDKFSSRFKSLYADFFHFISSKETQTVGDTAQMLISSDLPLSSVLSNITSTMLASLSSLLGFNHSVLNNFGYLKRKQNQIQQDRHESDSEEDSIVSSLSSFLSFSSSYFSSSPLKQCVHCGRLSDLNSEDIKFCDCGGLWNTYVSSDN
ncbi:wd repeat-containing protein [Anaeramoeba ignava]|uniref:Wd repeat-containing protein n=1 Tax=Anaeramoeba ignava TaxID=1746090 RepID=A0A9Q0LQS7_ANAIG|nr:wd repeat-containing protein [Anaeramoeba ignava]